MEVLLPGSEGWFFTCRREEIAAIHDAPFLELVFQAAAVHRKFNDPSMVRAPATTPTCHHLSAFLGAVARGLDHRRAVVPLQVQRCTLLSIKTGGCPETCTYCSQSSSWSKTTGWCP